MKVAWFSAGVSSFLSAYMSKPDKLIYIHIDDQHEDTKRFLHDCEWFMGKEIEVLQSNYKTVDKVARQFRYLNGVSGAKCTEVLKKRVRKEWENKNKGLDITYVWGFDATEARRANSITESMNRFKHEFPLIDEYLSKEDVHEISSRMGLKRPKMYDMGYRNNNCIGCLKGGKGYWNRIRKDFPEIFKLRALRERELNASCINGTFLDELDPHSGRLEEEIMHDCSIFCHMAYNDIGPNEGGENGY